MRTLDEVRAIFRDEHFHVFKELGVYHWVSGGALVSTFLNEPIRDIDYFFPDQNSANLALDFIVKRGFRITATEKDHDVVEKNGRVIDVFHRGETPQETMALFDYEHVCAAIDSELNFYQHDNFNQRLADKKLVVQSAEDFNPIQDWPVAIPRRALKFLKRGYTIDHENLVVILERCIFLNNLRERRKRE